MGDGLERNGAGADGEGEGDGGGRVGQAEQEFGGVRGWGGG